MTADCYGGGSLRARSGTYTLEADAVIMLNIPLTLRERLGDEAAEALVTLFNHWEQHLRGDVIEVSAQRFEVRLAETAGQLRREMAQIETRLTRAMADLETRLTGRMAALETAMTDRMAALETRVVRWMFVFWAGQIAILFTFFKP